MDPTESYSTFEQHLFQRASQMHTPIYGVFELLPLCNLNCDMCYVRLDQKEMNAQGKLRTAGQWIDLARQAKDAGALFLLLTGGEPLLFPDFQRLFSELQGMGMILTLNTNGTLMDEDWADFFAKHRPRRINITLYGASNDTYETLCHSSDGFDRALRGIQLLRERNIDVKINGSLTRLNVDDRMKIIEIGKKLDIPVRLDTYMYPAVRERSRPYHFQTRLDPDMAAKVRVEILRAEMGEEIFQQYLAETLFKAEHIIAGDPVPGHMTCRAGQCSFVINWQGQMRSCVVLDEPSIPVFDNAVTFSSAWNQVVETTASIETSPVCNQCSLRAVCNTCAASAMAECGSYDAVPDYVCRYTKSTIKYLKRLAAAMEESPSPDPAM